MPLYEYLCRKCHRIYTFMHPTMAGAETPPCPRCGSQAMERQISRFAFVRGGTDPFAAIPGEEQDRPAEGAPERDSELHIIRGDPPGTA